YRPVGVIEAIRSGCVSAGLSTVSVVGGGGGAVRRSRQLAQGHCSRSSRTLYSRTCPSLHTIRNRSGAVSFNSVGDAVTKLPSCQSPLELSLIDEAPPLPLEARQRRRRRQFHFDLQTQPQIHLLGDPSRS